MAGIKSCEDEGSEEELERREEVVEMVVGAAGGECVCVCGGGQVCGRRVGVQQTHDGLCGLEG